MICCNCGVTVGKDKNKTKDSYEFYYIFLKRGHLYETNLRNLFISRSLVFVHAGHSVVVTN